MHRQTFQHTCYIATSLWITIMKIIRSRYKILSVLKNVWKKEVMMSIHILWEHVDVFVSQVNIVYESNTKAYSLIQSKHSFKSYPKYVFFSQFKFTATEVNKHSKSCVCSVYWFWYYFVPVIASRREFLRFFRFHQSLIRF